MISDGEYVAVVDRFEGDLAVVLVEDEGETIAEVAVPKSKLPEDGCHQDAILAVVVQDGDLVDASYDETETERRSTEAQDRFDRLAERPPRDDEDHESTE